MVKEEHEFDNIHSFPLKCLMRGWKFVQFIWTKTQNFLYSQRLFAKHHTRSSLCQIFHGRSLSYVFNSIQFCVYCCHSNVHFTSNYILATFNSIVISFLKIFRSVKKVDGKRQVYWMGTIFQWKVRNGYNLCHSFFFFINRFFLECHT